MERIPGSNPGRAIDSGRRRRGWSLAVVGRRQLRI